MKPKKRQKLCYNCEGDVDLDVIVCPFCAADLRQEKPEQQRASFSAAAHSVKQLGGQEPLYANSRTPEPVFAPPTEELIMPSEENPQTEDRSEAKTALVATALFTFGVQLFLLALFMFFFQSRGSLILKWDARLWFLYLFTSAPLIYFGYRSLSKVDR